jgi:hypothetical protein
MDNSKSIFFHDSNTEFHLGVNSGIGAELYLTDNVQFTVKANYNSVFGTGGSANFVSGFSGLTFKFRK